VLRGLVLHWDGSTWPKLKLPDPTDKIFEAIGADSADDVWVTGSYQGQGIAERWDGTHWTAMALPNPGVAANTIGIAAVGPKDVWAVGVYEDSDEFFLHTLTEHWDGSSWTVVNSPDRDPKSNESLGVAATATDDVWTVGFWGGDGGGQVAAAEPYNQRQFTLTEHWDGTTWSHVAMRRAPSPAALNSVGVVSPNNVWAVGYQSGAHDPTNLVEHWNGARWKIVPSPAASQTGYLLSVDGHSASDAWAVGYSVTNGFAQTWIQHWDGKNWSES